MGFLFIWLLSAIPFLGHDLEVKVTFSFYSQNYCNKVYMRYMSILLLSESTIPSLGCDFEMIFMFIWLYLHFQCLSFDKLGQHCRMFFGPAQKKDFLLGSLDLFPIARNFLNLMGICTIFN